MASTAVRVHETLELLLSQWNIDCPVVWEKQLYLASPETLTHHLRSLDKTCCSVLLVGHNPGISELLSQLIGNEISMPTACLAMLSASGSEWTEALKKRPWEQIAVWNPREL